MDIVAIKTFRLKPNEHIDKKKLKLFESKYHSFVKFLCRFAWGQVRLGYLVTRFDYN